MLYGFIFIAVVMAVVGVVMALDHYQRWRIDKEARLEQERIRRRAIVREMKACMRIHPLFFIRDGLLPDGFTFEDHANILQEMIDEMTNE